MRGKDADELSSGWSENIPDLNEYKTHRAKNRQRTKNRPQRSTARPVIELRTNIFY